MELRSQRNPKPTAKELLASEWMNPLVNRFYKNIIIRWKQLKNVSYEEKAEFTKVPLISVLLTINKQWYLLSVHISLVAQIVKHLSAMQETWVWSLGPEDPLEKEMATHSSILAWRIPWTEEPGGLQSTGSQRVRTGLIDFTSQIPSWGLHLENFL